jgi:hypothetical protein
MASRVVFFVGVVLLVVLSFGLVGTAFVSWWGMGFGPRVETTPLWVYPVIVYVAYFILPVLIFLPILLPLALTWKNPRRIVVFRRFNTPLEAKRLRRIAARHLGRVGHVFTLADSQIHRSLFVRIPPLLGQLSFLHFRPRRVHDNRGLARLERLLDQYWRLNINWLVSYRKIFPTATSDEYWRRSVGVLLEKAELVVMDISNFSASMEWEIAECHRRELLSRTILLVSRDKAGQSEEMLARMAQAEGPGLDRTAFAYSSNNVEQPDALRERIGNIFRQEGTSNQAISAWQVSLTMAATLVVSLGLAAAGVVASAPYLFSELAGRYSPFRSQVWTAYRMTASPNILSRLMADDREETLTTLGEHASDRTSVMRRTAILALSDVGDQRDIALLIHAIGDDRPISPDRADDDRLKTLVRRSDPEADALTHLVTRLGQPALRPLLQAMTLAPRLPFDDHLEDEFIHVQAKGAPPEVFEPLLAAPNQAGRFAAALELAPLKKDPRVIPILLEIVRGARPDVGLGLHAQELLSQWPHDAAGIDWTRLDPYIFGNDVAAERAARLAFDASDRTYLVRTVEHVPDGAGQRLLTHLFDRARMSDEAATTARAHALLARASPTWTKSLLSDPDVAIRAKAAYALAERGDPSALSIALAVSKMRGTCETILFIRSECNPYLDDALAAIDLMRVNLHPPLHLTADAGAMTGLPQVMLESLVQLLLVAGDDRTTRELFAVLHPSTRPEEAEALKRIGGHLDPSSLRRLVRALPREPGTDRTALLSGLAQGLKWRDLDSPLGMDFCDAVKVEARTDLLNAWRAAGNPCASDR